MKVSIRKGVEMAQTEKEKAAAKAKREKAIKAEQVRWSKLTDAEKAAEKAAKLAASPVLKIVVSKGEKELVTLTSKHRAWAGSLAKLAKENDLNCVISVPVHIAERVVKIAGVD